MRALALILIASVGLFGCSTFQKSDRKICIESWHGNAGTGLFYEVSDTALQISSLNDFGRPRKLISSVRLSYADRDTLWDFVGKCPAILWGKSYDLPRQIDAGDRIILSGERIYRLQVRDSRDRILNQISGFNYLPDEVALLMARLDQSVPEKLRIKYRQTSPTMLEHVYVSDLTPTR